VIAHVLAEHGILVSPIDDVLRQYFAQCAITASVQTLAKAALFLADRAGGTTILDEASVRRVNAVLLTSGRRSCPATERSAYGARPWARRGTPLAVSPP
jgi:glutaminase